MWKQLLYRNPSIESFVTVLIAVCPKYILTSLFYETKISIIKIQEKCTRQMNWQNIQAITCMVGTIYNLHFTLSTFNDSMVKYAGGVY